MKINTDFIKYDFLNNKKIKDAYLALKNDKNPACDLFRVYGTIQIERYFVCIGKIECFLKNEIILDYIFLDIDSKKCKSIVRVSEFDIQQLTKTNLFLDDIYNLISFTYNDKFYNAVDFDLNYFF